MTFYVRGTTLTCEITLKDEDGAAQDPTDLSLHIIGPDGSIQETKAMGELTKEETGVYIYDYFIPADADYGTWNYTFTATADVVTKFVGYFTIAEIESLLYCSVEDVYRHAGVDNTVKDEDTVLDEIREAGAMVDRYFQRRFIPNQTATEWIDIEDLDEDDDIREIFLTHRPVLGVTSMKSYDPAGNPETTWESTEYKLDLDIGRIRLREKKFVKQDSRVEVVYTHGYSTVPNEIKSLTGMIAAMRILIAQIGGTFDDVTSYSLPVGVSIGVGEPYTNMRESITRLEKERDLLLKSIGQLRTMVFVI